MSNVICIHTHRALPQQPQDTASIVIRPGSRLITTHGADNWVVFRICYDAYGVAGYECSRAGIRTFLRPEHVAGVMA